MENEVEVRGPPVSKSFDDHGNPTKVIPDYPFLSSPWRLVGFLKCTYLAYHAYRCHCFCMLMWHKDSPCHEFLNYNSYVKAFSVEPVILCQAAEGFCRRYSAQLNSLYRKSDGESVQMYTSTCVLDLFFHNLHFVAALL